MICNKRNIHTHLYLNSLDLPLIFLFMLSTPTQSLHFSLCLQINNIKPVHQYVFLHLMNWGKIKVLFRNVTVELFNIKKSIQYSQAK